MAQTLDDASAIFRDRLKFALDHLHPALRPIFKVVSDSQKELRFSHGSYVRVGTSLRGSTLNMLHVSEFGKICAQYPERAQEVITGSLQTVQAGQNIFIESTAEGREGFFFDMCERAFKHQGKLGSMDFKPFFFPWYRENAYSLSDEEMPSGSIVADKIPQNLNEYFDALSNRGIRLLDGQKLWYAKKAELLQDDITREYPSFPEEAFAASQIGNWYASQIRELYDTGHVTTISYDKSLPVHTAWDLGQSDAMSIWFFQINRAGEIMIIDYFERSDTSIDQIAQVLTSKGYTYGTHLWPHDARARDRAGITFEMQAREFNLTGLVLEQHGLIDGINKVRTTLPRMWFARENTKDGLKALAAYKKRWNNQLGGFTSDPVHDWASHASDSMRYLCAGLDYLLQRGSVEEDMKALNQYWGI